MLAAERGAARNTIEAYRRDLDDFAAYARARHGEPEDADAGMVRGYITKQADLGMSPRTGARRLSALRQFFRFLLLEGIRTDDPSTTIDRPRQGRSLPKYLSEPEVARLLDAARRRSGPDGARLNALMELLYATGLRVSELVQLPLSALSRDDGMLIVRGKGDKERMVPLTEPAIDALETYAQVRDDFLPPKVRDRRESASPWLFPSRSTAGHLTRARFAQVLKELAVEAEIEPRTSVATCAPPFFRKSFARSWRRPSQPSTNARPCRHRNNTDLHSRSGQSFESACCPSPPSSKGQSSGSVTAVTTLRTCSGWSEGRMIVYKV